MTAKVIGRTCKVCLVGDDKAYCAKQPTLTAWVDGIVIDRHISAGTVRVYVARADVADIYHEWAFADRYQDHLLVDVELPDGITDPRDPHPRVSLDDPEPEALPMLLWCPECGARHVDAGPFARKVHHTHACQSCGMTWRPAVKPTVGVQFLPGFKDSD